jgi:hypothetical protein
VAGRHIERVLREDRDPDEPPANLELEIGRRRPGVDIAPDFLIRSGEIGAKRRAEMLFDPLSEARHQVKVIGGWWVKFNIGHPASVEPGAFGENRLALGGKGLAMSLATDWQDRLDRGAGVVIAMLMSRSPASIPNPTSAVPTSTPARSRTSVSTSSSSDTKEAS